MNTYTAKHCGTFPCVSTLVTLLCLGLLTACGGNSGTDGKSADSIKLSVLEESFVPGGSGNFELRTSEEGDLLRVDVTSTGASDLRALYFDLAYDSAQLHPVSAEATGKLTEESSAGTQLLELAVLHDPGVLHHGQILGNWQDKSGFSGEGVLTTVFFATGPQRQVAFAPTDSSSKAILTYNIATNTLEWRYASRGDYDQNSLVTIADLTPLGANLGAAGPFAYNTSLSVVDGDNNGLITIADITPIGASFGKRVQGYNVYRSADPTADYPATPTGPNGPGAVLMGTVDFTASASGPTERRLYQFTVPFPSVSDSYWVRPFDPDGEGIASGIVDGNGNQAPTALLIATPGIGAAPLTVSFDPSGSFDPDGTLQSYEYDWEGDGIYDLGVGGPGLQSHEYTVPGMYLVAMRVTDNNLAMAVDYEVVQVTGPTGGTWHISTMFEGLPGDDVGRYNSIASIGGIPAVAYIDATTTQLYYARASDALATTWPDFSVVGSLGNVGVPAPPETTNVALVEADGLPAVAYYINSELYYARANDLSNPAVWGSPSPMLLDSGAGLELSMAIVNGHPAIVYSDVSPSSLWYLRADSTDGTSWFDPPVGFGVPGRNTSLAYINGKPMFSFQDQSDDHLWFFWSSSSNGVAGSWNFETPTTQIPLGSSDTWLAEVNGTPALAFSDPGTGSMGYVRANDTTYTSWTPVSDPLAGLSGTRGGFPAMALVAGNPVISYFHETEGDLQFIRALDGDGLTWGAAEVVDSPAAATVGSHSHMVVIGGNPIISYYDETNGDLKVAIYY